MDDGLVTTVEDLALGGTDDVVLPLTITGAVVVVEEVEAVLLRDRYSFRIRSASAT
jgi:hypothetical protein